MRGADGYNESLFSTVRLEEFVPQAHPLRQIRMWLNEALSKMDAKFSAMYEVDVKRGRPSIAPEKLTRAMLLQVLYSIRSERQLVEQISYKLNRTGNRGGRAQAPGIPLTRLSEFARPPLAIADGLRSIRDSRTPARPHVRCFRNGPGNQASIPVAMTWHVPTRTAATG
ncbi:hypothetical protein B7759_05794 (plasmid) [Burkholderia glumae]|nr:hypothetical protein KS03_5914 [Burkholderia glumae LMG 2196 = ATCC 33617]QTP37152.1 hypothetical protein B7759_05794 [Burkholderia glumae]